LTEPVCRSVEAGFQVAILTALPAPPKLRSGGVVDSNISFYQPIRGSAPDEIAPAGWRRTPVKLLIFFLISFSNLTLELLLITELL
jgi:hypothetical protein